MMLRKLVYNGGKNRRRGLFCRHTSLFSSFLVRGCVPLPLALVAESAKLPPVARRAISSPGDSPTLVRNDSRPLFCLPRVPFATVARNENVSSVQRRQEYLLCPLDSHAGLLALSSGDSRISLSARAIAPESSGLKYIPGSPRTAGREPRFEQAIGSPATMLSGKIFGSKKRQEKGSGVFSRPWALSYPGIADRSSKMMWPRCAMANC